MKKVFTKIAGLSVGLALAIGVGVVAGSRSAKLAKAADVTTTWTASAQGFSNQQQLGGDTYNFLDANVTITFGTASGNGHKYYNNGTAVRSYGDNSFTIACATGTITSITLSNDQTKEVTANVGTYSSNSWTGSSSSVTFTVATGSGNFRTNLITVVYSTGSSKSMTIKLNDASEGPFEINYNGSSSYLFYAKEGTTTVDAEWSVGNSSILSVSENDNHVAVVTTLKAGTTTLIASASGYTTTSVDITVSAGTLESISVSGVMSKTRYAIGASWDPTGFVVTANYSTGYSADVTSEATWSFEHDTSSTSTTSVIAYASFGGITHSGYAQAVTVYEGASYEFEKNFDTYASAWNTTYGPRTITGSNVGSSSNATISFTYACKQSGTITTMPVVAGKSGQTSTMSFVLASSVAEDYTISSVEVEFVRWAASKKVAAALYKGTSVSGDPLDSFAKDDAPKTLSTSNLNGDSFIVDFTTTESQNQQLGVKAIYIGLEEKSAYGETDHIKVTSFPRTVYHVGEKYDSTGLVVTAYDGANEDTANYKDVTASVSTGFTSGVYTFDDSDVPTVDMWVEYHEGLEVFSADDITMYVYAVAEYELVTSAPADWSGSYLIVSSYIDGEEAEHTVAINSTLTNFDQPLNFVEVSVDGSTITSGQECEFTVKPYSDGYSVQGKNGKYAYGSSSYRFQTSDSEQKVSFAMGEESVVTVTGAASYNLRLNTSAAGSERFGFYKDGVANVKLYKLVESSAATEFAQTFMGAFTCDSTGENKPSFGIKEGSTKWTWALLASEYDKLSAADKELFRLGAPSTAEGASDIAKALARYDYIVGKYFATELDLSFTDFMERNPSPIASGRFASFFEESNDSTMIIIIAIAGVSALALTTLLVLKKKKHN